MIQWIWVFIGGGLGSIARYGFSVATMNYSQIFPWGTLLANLASCAIAAWVLFYLSTKFNLSRDLQLLLVSGFCGGFSTFSTFSIEVFKMLQMGRYLVCAVYITASLIMALSIVWIIYEISKYEV